jgi:hypothetical protein
VTTVTHKLQKNGVHPVRLAEAHAAQGTPAHGQLSNPRAACALLSGAGPGVMAEHGQQSRWHLPRN